MELNFANNLFLGKEELNHLKESLGDKGYRRMFQQLVKDYGVVKLDSDTSFSYLKVVQGTLNGQITINTGVAIDSNIDTIDIESDLIDELTIPGDSTLRYIVIEYSGSPVAKGTVSISSTGQVTGVGTEFTKYLRGLPNFPSVITFNGSANNLEYRIASITSDTDMQLNIASGILVTESSKTYSIVGTFTPGATVAAPQKYPMQFDGYTITTQLTDTVNAGTQFILASVLNDGTSTTIIDLRETKNIFSIGAGSSSSSMTSTSVVVGHDSMQTSGAKSPKHKTLLETTWSFNSDTGNWTYSSSTQEITISTGEGGSLVSVAGFNTGDFDGWYVLEESTGQMTKIITSIASGGNVVLAMEFALTVTTASDIKVVPSADFIEFLTSTASSKPIANRRYIFPITAGTGQMEVISGETYLVKWRHILGDKTTPWMDVNDGDAYNDTNFDDDGVYTGGAGVSYTVGGGGILAPLNTLNHEDDKASRSLANTFSGSNEFSSIIDISGHLIKTPEVFTLNVTDPAYSPSSNNIRAGSSGPVTPGFTGIAGGVDGKVIIIACKTSSFVDFRLSHESGLASSSNRIILPSSGGLSIPKGESVTLMYDGELLRWKFKSASFSVVWSNETNPTVSYTGSVTAGISVDSGNTSIDWGVDHISKTVTVNGILNLGAAVSDRLSQINIPFPLGVSSPSINSLVAVNVLMSSVGSFTSNQQRPCFAVVTATGIKFINLFDSAEWERNAGSRYEFNFSAVIKIN